MNLTHMRTKAYKPRARTQLVLDTTAKLFATINNPRRGIRLALNHMYNTLWCVLLWRCVPCIVDDADDARVFSFCTSTLLAKAHPGRKTCCPHGNSFLAIVHSAPACTQLTRRSMCGECAGLAIRAAGPSTCVRIWDTAHSHIHHSHLYQYRELDRSNCRSIDMLWCRAVGCYMWGTRRFADGEYMYSYVPVRTRVDHMRGIDERIRRI